jgi:hypothetical protein
MKSQTTSGATLKFSTPEIKVGLAAARSGKAPKAPKAVPAKTAAKAAEAPKTAKAKMPKSLMEQPKNKKLIYSEKPGKRMPKRKSNG